MLEINQVHQGDCLELMAEIPDGSVDLIVTDPPYPDYYVEEFTYFDGILDVFNSFSCRQFIFWSAKAEFPLDYSARHICDKITGAACQYDFIYERNGNKKQRVFRGHRINSTVSAQFAGEIFTGHKSQKPLNVIGDLLNYGSNEGNTILDPFSGSGTTGVACKRWNRNFILIEKEPEYCEIARRRLDAEDNLFSEAV